MEELRRRMKRTAQLQSHHWRFLSELESGDRSRCRLERNIAGIKSRMRKTRRTVETVKCGDANNLQEEIFWTAITRTIGTVTSNLDVSHRILAPAY